MKNIVLKFGLIAGIPLAALTAVMVPLCIDGTLAMSHSQVIGYTAMVLAYLAVFFGIRSYREKVNGGAITFGRAFKVGILITFVTCAVYVIGWEIVYWNFLPDFEDKYAAATLKQMRADGATAEKIAEAETKLARFKELYKNPFFNVGITFLEVFPVGLIVTLVSAAILKRKVAPGPPAPATVMA